MMSALLRKKTSSLLKGVYRLTQAVSRNAVDSHIENYLIDDFVNVNYGSAYGVVKQTRIELVKRMRLAAGHIPSATRMLYHVILARELLKIVPAASGDVIECGVYKGASSAALSLACALVGRKLWVCDSFAGLPISEADIIRNYPHLKVYRQYRRGMYTGTQMEVRENIRQYGAIEHCEFVPGLFSETLPGLSAKFVLRFWMLI